MSGRRLRVLPADGEVGVYDSSRLPHPSLRELFELLRYRDLIVQLVSRDVRTRYKRSVLGVTWTMLNPLLMMIALTIVFSRVFRGDVPHYPVYLLSAQLAWAFFAQTTTQAMNHLSWGGPLITKIYLPRTVFAVSQIGTGLVNLTLALVPLFVITVAAGASLTWAVLWLPLAMLLLACFALGISLLLSTVAISFPDIADMYQVVLTVWYFLTPIIYPLAVLDGSDRWLMSFNPMYHLVEGFRTPVYSGVGPGAEVLFAAAGVAFATLVAGWIAFTSGADDIPARI